MHIEITFFSLQKQVKNLTTLPHSKQSGRGAFLPSHAELEPETG